MKRPSRLVTRPRLERLDERMLLTALTPAQIDSAYGLNAVTFSNGAIKGNGAGQTIAIIDAYNDPSIYRDLTLFDARYGLPNPYITPNLPASGNSPNGQAAFSMANFAGTTTDPLWNEEEALDVEMAHAAAPMANIILAEARTPTLYDFITAINAVKTLPSVSVVSMSWGSGEFNGLQGLDGVFTTPAGHRGITYVASSGDGGAAPGAQWPASSPNVVGVGGTSLVVSATGARVSEAAWAGSGGGISQIEPKPVYQAQVVAGGSRSTPDVSIVADPGTGVTINSWNTWMGVGGTSLSAPLWAGLFAVADQGLAVAGKSSLVGGTQALPDLYKAPAGSFFDITSGNRAKPGFDTSTGLGSPNAPTLIRFLDGASAPLGVAGGGVVTTGVGGGKSTSANLAFPIAGSFPSASPVEAAILPIGPPIAVPNLVATPLPTVATDPAATDSVLEQWGLAGSAPSTSSTTFRTKPRG